MFVVVNSCYSAACFYFLEQMNPSEATSLFGSAAMTISCRTGLDWTGLTNGERQSEEKILLDQRMGQECTCKSSEHFHRTKKVRSFASEQQQHRQHWLKPQKHRQRRTAHQRGNNIASGRVGRADAPAGEGAQTDSRAPQCNELDKWARKKRLPPLHNKWLSFSLSLSRSLATLSLYSSCSPISGG